MKGKIKWFSDDLGYGFITGENGTDFFVHKSSMDPDVVTRDGSAVIFEEGEGKKGPKALNVKPEQK